ncbi:DUF4342 domain-containing protein [Clostridium sp. CX1]|uniref:DUF4342 domain-containing protein n=1 Tax=Clostridium tanneri TaxID=3037988 RepID=A0ABU4JNT5_9CLOT|nr:MULTISPECIES: DUF4342 domain-containing protein [unclassified Clostridium]MCT8976240.1 DUF4342 domain-containing protein [Clostridium sp. CX1]MDW8799805.1 DUF4342 domain-containing protein [Clostridium sp. A1-XYC3]
MGEITLEKIDVVRERTGVSYTEAKEALEACEGNVVDALIYIEKNQQSTMDNIYTSKDDFLNWLKDLVKKGNINRIRIKKDDKVVVDIPVNAGIAATLTLLVWPPLIAIGILTAVVTKVTIEITKDDGTVEIVNKVIKSGVKDTMEDVKETVKDVKDKVFDAASTVKDKFAGKSDNKEEQNTYQYTVKFEDIDSENETYEDKNFDDKK